MAGDVLILSSAAGDCSTLLGFGLRTAGLILLSSFCVYAHVCALSSKLDVVHPNSCSRLTKPDDICGRSMYVVNVCVPLIVHLQYTFITSPPILWVAPTYQTCTIDNPNVSNLYVF